MCVEAVVCRVCRDEYGIIRWRELLLAQKPGLALVPASKMLVAGLWIDHLSSLVCDQCFHFDSERKKYAFDSEFR